MAAITLEELRSIIRFRGDYQNVRKFPDADVDKEIQGAFAEFYGLVAKTHEGWWDTEGTITTVASQAYIALPSTCWRVQGVDRLDTSDYETMAQIGLGERNRWASSTTDTGKPVAYRLSARGLELYPTPDAAYTLRVLFTPMAPKLSVSQPREYYNGWEDYVIEATLLVLDRREKMPINERAAVLESIKNRVMDEASERRSAEPEYLLLREYDDFDPYKDGLY